MFLKRQDERGGLQSFRLRSVTYRGYAEAEGTSSGSRGRFIFEKRSRAVWNMAQRYQPKSRRSMGTVGETPLMG
jgi:hypothetical protein